MTHAMQASAAMLAMACLACLSYETLCRLLAMLQYIPHGCETAVP